MKFLSLEIQNFLAIGYSGPLSLDGRGLCLIQGVNGDDTSAGSNGSGKSSIVDALAWCLYGTTARGISGDAVVNNVAKKDTAVVVTIKDGSTTYMIGRFRKHRDHKNSLIVECLTDSNPAIIDLTKGTDKETQELVNQIMGCSLEVFMAAVYAGQETMPDLPKMTDKQLKTLIEEAAGVERLEQAYAKAREKRGLAESHLNAQKRIREVTEGNLAKTRLDIVSVKQKVEEFEVGRSGVNKAALFEAEECKANMVRTAADMRIYNEVKLRAEADDLDKKLGSYGILLGEQGWLHDELHKAENLVTKLATQFRMLSAEAKKIKFKLDNAEEAIKEPCSGCGKPGDEHDLKTFKDHVTKQLKNALLNLKACQVELSIAEGQVATTKKKYEDFTAKMPDMSYVHSRRSQISDSLEKLGKLKNRLLLEKKDYDSCLERAKNALSAPNPHAETWKHLEVKEVGCLKDIDASKIDIEEAQKQLSICESVVKVFGPAGVRAHILDTVTPFLNDRTADYLSALSDGNITAIWSTLSTTAKGELKEKFNIEVSNDKGADSFAGLSGGEKRKVRLATMLALQDLVASRATKNIELYMADEIDDALDPAGLERLMTVLDRKAKERGTVLVISHNELSDWIPQVCTVTKSGGKSTIEGALSL